MKESDIFNDWLKLSVGFALLISILIILASVAYSHGGKHTAEEFTHLQALKKATGLYDQLIGKGKLDDWS